MTDSWGDATESGLLDNYELEVDDPWFGLNEESETDERIFLWLRGTAVDDEGEEHEEFTERYSIGKGWEVVDGGKAVEKLSGKPRFNRNSGMGRFLDTLIGLDDKDLTAALRDGGETYEASTYKGLKLHQERREVNRFTDRETGEEVVVEMALPTSASFAKATKKRAAKKEAAPSRRRKPKADDDDGLRAELVAFAKEEFEDDEHDEFVSNVLDDSVFSRADEITANDELNADVLNPEGSIWTEARG